jgi:hypothetical protein
VRGPACLLHMILKQSDMYGGAEKVVCLVIGANLEFPMKKRSVPGGGGILPSPTIA